MTFDKEEVLKEFDKRFNMIDLLWLDGQLVNGKEYIKQFIDSVFTQAYQAGKREQVERDKKQAVLDYILSLGWQDTNNEYVKEVLEDAEKLATDILKEAKE